jgi:hypothetical protein
VKGFFFRCCSLVLLCSMFGCAPRNLADVLGVKPRHLTPEEWAALSKPGSHHEVLSMLVGEWDVDVVSWSDPNANPERFRAYSSAAWVLGYRFVREKFKSLAEGPRYEGLGFIGYDSGGNLYNTVWMDSLNTAVATSKGTFDPTTATFALKGEMYDPLSGRTKETHTFIRILSKDSYEVSMVDRTARGQDFRALELTYRRRSHKTPSFQEPSPSR